MRKAWFCYQLGADHPVPVIIYDDLPETKNFLRPTILQSHELKEEKWFVNYDGNKIEDEVTTSFNILCQYFPYGGIDYIPADKPNLDLIKAVTAEELGPAELR